MFSDALRYLSHISKSDSKLVNQQFLWMTENSSWLGKIVSDINGLVEKDIVHNIKSAKKLIDNRDERVWDIVEDVIKEHPVMLKTSVLYRLFMI